MSDPKRPGSRDISELKARLGLKKGPAQPSGKGATPAPPGMALPAPPGMKTPQPTGPTVPSATDDPFGAMNAMAQIGTMQRAPEIVIVNDGKPVENVAASKRGVVIAKYAAIALVPLIVGAIVGKIGHTAAVHNQSVKGAKGLLADLKKLKKELNGVKNAITENVSRGGFTPDKELTATLKGISEKLSIDGKVFIAMGTIPADVSGPVLSFYAGAAEVKTMVDQHVLLAGADDMAYAGAAAAGDKAKLKENENAPLAGSYRYAVVLSAPGEGDPQAPFGARLVELGPPYCGGDKLSTDGTCGDGVTGFAYRDREGVWSKGQPASPGSSFPTKVVVPLVTNPVTEALMRGNDKAAAELAYGKRLQTMLTRLETLIDEGNAAERTLNAKANQGERFTFFM